MHRFIIAGTAVLLGTQLALAAPPGSFRPMAPPRPSANPVPTPGIPALAVYPSFQAYTASAFFYHDFARRYDEQFPLMMFYPMPVPQLPPAPEVDPARAKISLQVPETAEVFIEGEKLKQNGVNREFYSSQIPEGERAIYEVLVRWSDGKNPLERKLTVTVGRGEKPVLLVMNPLSK